MRILIGIDPDVEKSGVAYYESDTKKLELSNLTFFQLFDYLQHVERNKADLYEVTVVIEAGWLNKSNWHVTHGTANINAQIGQRTGANHEVGKKIVEMCQYIGLNYELVKPTKSKIKHKYFAFMTGILQKTNQEQRDAGMLVWGR